MLKQKFSESEIVILIGYLLSTSLYTFIRLETDEETHNNFRWIIGLCFILAFLLIGFWIYFTSEQCTFMLEVSEYILLPVSGFFAIQLAFDYSKEDGLTNRYGEFAIFLITFLSIQGLILLKIFYMNQTYPNSPNKNILRFEISGRIARVLKNVVALLAIVPFNENDHNIVLIVINCIDFAINAYKITFLKLELEEYLCFANVNNIFSIALSQYFGHTTTMTELTFIILLTLLFVLLNEISDRYISSKLLQWKLENFLKTISKSNSDLLTLKKRIVLLISVFSSIYTFSIENKHIEPKDKFVGHLWDHFVYRLRTMYVEILLMFFLELEEVNTYKRKTEQTENAETENIHVKQYKKVKSIKVEKNTFDGQIESNLINACERVFGVKMNFNEIVCSRKAFLDFLGFCMDHLERKDHPRLPYSYSNEFFLTFATELGQNFMMKKIELCYRRLNLEKENIWFKKRTGKVLYYLKNLKNHYDVGFLPLEKYVLFSNEFEKLKDKIVDVCGDEINFLKKFLDQNESTVNPFSVEKDLSLRRENKESVVRMIEKCCQNTFSVNFSDFPFVVLLFMVGVYKSISKTTEMIQKHFRVPLKSKKDSKEELKSMNNKILSAHPILVCTAFSAPGEYRMGTITGYNEQFKEKFGVGLNYDYSKKNITDLIPMQTQKSKHNTQMRNKNEFQSQEDSLTLPKIEHEEYVCYLKVNLEKENVHILQTFTISTRVFYSLEGYFAYVCKLEQKSADSFLLEENFNTLTLQERSNIDYDPQTRIQEEQLDSIMTLVKADNDELIMFGYLRNPLFTQFAEINGNEGSHDNLTNFINDEEKDIKVEKKINNDFSLSFKIKIFLCLFSTLMMVFANYYIISGSDENAEQAQKIAREMEQFVSGPQACQAKIAEILYFLKFISEYSFLDSIVYGLLPEPTFSLHSKNQLNSITEKISVFMKVFFNKNMESIPLLETDKINQMNNNISDIEQNSFISEALLDFTNLMFNSSTMAQWLGEETYVSLPSWKKEIYLKFVDENSKFFLETTEYEIFRLSYENAKKLINEKSKENQKVFVIGFGIIGVVFFIGLGSFLLAFAEIYKEYSLLWKLETTDYEKFINQIEKVSEEIENSRKYQFIRCNFVEENVFTLTKHNGAEIEKQELTFYEFESKICKETEKKSKSFEISLENKNKYIQIIKGKFILFTILLILLGITIPYSLNIWEGSQKIIRNSLQLNEILFEAGNTKSTMLSIEQNSFFIMLGDYSIRSEKEARETYNRALEYLRKHLFYKTFYGIEDTEILHQTLFKPMCTLFTENSLGNLTYCETTLGILSEVRINEFVEFLTLILDREIIRTSPNILNIVTLLTLYIVNALFTNPLIEVLYRRVSGSINVGVGGGRERMKKEFLNVFLIVYAGFCIWFAVEMYKTKKAKGEAFTIDLVKNLSKKPKLEPVLNKIHDEVE